MGLSGLLYPRDQCCLPAVSYLTYCACRAAADRRWKDWLWLICWSYLWIVVHKWRPHNASTSSHLRWIGDEVKCWKSWTNWRSGDLKGQRQRHFFLRSPLLPQMDSIAACFTDHRFHGGVGEQMLSCGHKHVHNLPALVTTSPHACAKEARAPPQHPRHAPPPAMTPEVKQCQPHTHTHIWRGNRIWKHVLQYDQWLSVVGRGWGGT